MLVTRIYKPKAQDILYHYCSVETFAAIAEHKTIRFSDVNMMNDFNETRYGYEVFEEAANRILKDEVLLKKFPDFDRNVLDKIDEVVSSYQLYMHPLIACFSKNPDVLSQWRGYADNATGISVGFSATLLDTMPVTLLEVEYNREKQLSEMVTAILAIYVTDQERGGQFDRTFKDDCALLAAWSFGYKSDAFVEEQEVRCLHMLDIVSSEDRPRLVDAGGQSGGRPVKGQKVKFRVVEGAIIAYVDIPLPIKKNSQPISEVWLGPKNANGPGNILYLLGGNGIGGVRMAHSRATFR
jgi:hypothetical protein